MGWTGRHSRCERRAIALLALVALCAVGAGCSISSAAARSSKRLMEGWDIREQGLGVLFTGPASTVMAASDLAIYSMRSKSAVAGVSEVQWFRYYDGPMRESADVAILCHLDRTTHIATIRRLEDSVASEARYEPWQYPECIEVLSGTYELTVSYYSRETVEEGLSATTRTTESTVPSTTEWIADSGEVYVLTAVVGKASPAPGEGPQYSVRPRTKELWDSAFKLEVSHWMAAIVKVASRKQLDLPVDDRREQWRRHEDHR